jgi:serine/threonine protein phosphatase PrpC
MDVPGLHISRSIGDTIAKQVGVTASPEVQSYELSSEDRVIIILSEGVHARMSNQEALDIVARYRDPHQAAAQIVKKT